MEEPESLLSTEAEAEDSSKNPASIDSRIQLLQWQQTANRYDRLQAHTLSVSSAGVVTGLDFFSEGLRRIPAVVKFPPLALFYTFLLTEPANVVIQRLMRSEQQRTVLATDVRSRHLSQEQVEQALAVLGGLTSQVELAARIEGAFLYRFLCLVLAPFLPQSWMSTTLTWAMTISVSSWVYDAYQNWQQGSFFSETIKEQQLTQLNRITQAICTNVWQAHAAPPLNLAQTVQTYLVGLSHIVKGQKPLFSLVLEQQHGSKSRRDHALPSELFSYFLAAWFEKKKVSLEVFAVDESTVVLAYQSDHSVLRLDTEQLAREFTRDFEKFQKDWELCSRLQSIVKKMLGTQEQPFVQMEITVPPAESQKCYQLQIKASYRLPLGKEDNLQVRWEKIQPKSATITRKSTNEKEWQSIKLTIVPTDEARKNHFNGLLADQHMQPKTSSPAPVASERLPVPSTEGKTLETGRQSFHFKRPIRRKSWYFFKPVKLPSPYLMFGQVQINLESGGQCRLLYLPKHKLPYAVAILRVPEEQFKNERPETSHKTFNAILRPEREVGGHQGTCIRLISGQEQAELTRKLGFNQPVQLALHNPSNTRVYACAAEEKMTYVYFTESGQKEKQLTIMDFKAVDHKSHEHGDIWINEGPLQQVFVETSQHLGR